MSCLDRQGYAEHLFLERIELVAQLGGLFEFEVLRRVDHLLFQRLEFALHVLFGHVEERQTGWLRWYAFDPLALDLKVTALAIIAGVLAFWLHRGLIEVVAAMALLGVLVKFLTG